ncbi:MAG: hypothetical protein FWE30_08255, partial [Bacteroidales bacterium]|nr:hypothetical protein [Bacteroidales bacterium]
LTIATRQDRQGLFGVVDRGFLENLTLIGVDIRGRDFVGGIAGSFPIGSIENSSLMGTVEGRHFVGGMVGYVFNSSISFSTYLGNVQGDIYVGGLVGKHSINEGDRFLASAYAAPRIAPIELRENVVIAAVSGERYIGGLVGYSGRRTLISHGFFAGKIRGEAFSAGISGFFHHGARIMNAFVLLYDMPNSEHFTEITHNHNDRIHINALRYLNGEWFLNSNPLPTENGENHFLAFFNLLRLEQVFDRDRLTDVLGILRHPIFMLNIPFTESVLERLCHPFYVLNIPYGMEISLDAPLSIEIVERGFSPSLGSLLGVRFWIDNGHFNVSGSMRDIPKGVYAIPCSRDVDGRFETIWVLLNVI